MMDPWRKNLRKVMNMTTSENDFDWKLNIVDFFYNNYEIVKS